MNDTNWLNERRKEAEAFFQKLPIPSKGEAWLKTHFAREGLEGLASVVNVSNGLDAIEAQKWLPIPFLSAGCFLYGDQHSHPHLEESLKKQGVILLPLAEAAEKHSALVQQHLGKSLAKREEKFLAQNEAFWADGFFLYIPKDCNIETPILLVNGFTKNGITLCTRGLVVVETGAKANILHFSASKNSQASFNNSTMEIFVRPAAHLLWTDLQDFSPTTFDYSFKRIEVSADAHFEGILDLQGSKKGKCDLETVLNGSGASTDIFGLICADHKQHLEVNSLTHHVAPNTTANILIKATAKDEARTVFQGMIRIDKAAQKTNSYMENHNLILSEKAHTDTIPRLEIDADDVKASHGATVSHVDPEQMFYLKTRGLNGPDAEHLLVEGFYEDLFRHVPDETIRALLRRKAEQKEEQI